MVILLNIKDLEKEFSNNCGVLKTSQLTALNLVLKGGLFIFVLSGFESRATIDVDCGKYRAVLRMHGELFRRLSILQAAMISLLLK